MHQQSQESRPYRLTALVGLLTLLGGLLALPPAPAVASSTYLCTGYNPCQKAGYPHAGYRKASSTMYWRMYSGHNCTNYAAFRMVQSGLPNTRPWSGEGNASNWGRAMSKITDNTPMVGSIAWWKANAPGAGSSGHVAYVEQVVSNNEIVISEDSWGGDFHWRRITKSGRGWPSGFIHFNDVVLAPTTPPKVVGTPRVGTALTVNQGAWAPATTYAYQWSAAGKAIPGATGRTYTPSPTVLRQKVAVTVTATKRGYRPGRAVANAPSNVAPGAMANRAAPVVTGTAQVDEVLRLNPGTWAPAPVARAVQWFADGVAIPGATGLTLTLGQAQIDKRITARVTVRADGYARSALFSAATTPVLAGTIREVRPYTLAGRPAFGRTLGVRPGTVEPADAAASYTWLRDGVPIAGATGERYVLGADDVGARMSVRIDLTRRSYRSLSRTIPLAGRVTTRPTLRLAATGRPGRAIVKLRMRAPGVQPFKGRVTVQAGKRTESVRVVDGRARIVLADLKAGRHAIKVRFEGTTVVKPVRGRTTVRVLRR